jgi:hypothetical protein
VLAILLGAIAGFSQAAVNRLRYADPPAERIYFSALGKAERPVLGLEPKDFDLRIDGKPTPMEGFRAGLPHTDRSVPLVAWILLDFNPSIKNQPIKNQVDAVAGAFDMLHPESALGVKLVSDRSETLAPLAHDPKALRNAFLQYEQRRSELRVGIKTDSVQVGAAGIARALEYALDDIDEYVKSQPSLLNREVDRAAMIISDGNLNPSYNLKSLYEKAARANASLYPVFLPTGRFGPWIEYYFKLAEKTDGVAAFFGAISPGKDIYSPPSNNQAPNALTTNFIHMIRDINGKYSFTITPPPPAQKMRIKLICRVKGVKIRLARTILP